MTLVPPDPAIPPEGDPNDQAAQEQSRRERAAQDKALRDSQLENLMLRAGIDPAEGMNKLFFEGYKGELTNEAVVEAAKGYGLIKEPDPNTPPAGEVTDPAIRNQTGERQQAATGNVPDGNAPTEDPRVTAIRTGEDIMANGGTQEGAMGAAFDVIAAAGFGSQSDHRAPDPRAQWRPGEPDPRRPDLGW